MAGPASDHDRKDSAATAPPGSRRRAHRWGGRAVRPSRRALAGLPECIARLTASGGQASVELVGLLPLLAAVAIAAFTVIAARSASEQAGQAAEAGAVAMLQDRDPRAAARAALPDGARSRAEVTITGTKVRVRVRPRLPLPGLAGPLAGEAEADAGPEATTPARRQAGSRP